MWIICRRCTVLCINIGKGRYGTRIRVSNRLKCLNDRRLHRSCSNCWCAGWFKLGLCMWRGNRLAKDIDRRAIVSLGGAIDWRIVRRLLIANIIMRKNDFIFITFDFSTLVILSLLGRCIQCTSEKWLLVNLRLNRSRRLG